MVGSSHDQIYCSSMWVGGGSMGSYDSWSMRSCDETMFDIAYVSDVIMILYMMCFF